MGLTGFGYSARRKYNFFYPIIAKSNQLVLDDFIVPIIALRRNDALFSG